MSLPNDLSLTANIKIKRQPFERLDAAEKYAAKLYKMLLVARVVDERYRK